MCRLVFTFLLLACWSSTLPAQTEFQFSGYALDMAFAQRSNEMIAILTNSTRNSIVNVTRLRLRPELLVGDNGHLFCEYEISGLYHTTPVFLTAVREEIPHQLFDLRWTIRKGDRYDIRHFIDRLYYKFQFGNTEWSIGRQRVAWGTGRIWNPTDLFNPINPVDISKVEKDGVDAVSGKVFLGDFTDLTLIANPQMNNAINFGARFRTNVSEFDLSVVGGRFDRRLVIGGDFAGNVFDAGVRGELMHSMAEHSFPDRYIMLVLGADYQFTKELYALVEYHFNGRGKGQKDSYEILPLAEGSILNLARQYTTIMATWLAHPLALVTASVTHNFNDGSSYVNTMVSYGASDNINATLGGQVFLGSDLSEFWYYPTALYLKVDAYF